MKINFRPFSLILASLMALVLRAADSGYEFAPEIFVPHIRDASASKFVWPSDGPVTNGAVAYFRYKFNLPSVPVDASFYFMFDDSGAAYMNGNLLAGQGSRAYQYLVAGENTVALALTNAVSASAAIFTIRCFDSKNSETRKITAAFHSDSSVKGTVNLPPSGWTQPGFDDSSWPAVTIVGDAFTDTWYKEGDWRYDQINSYHVTPEEKANFEAGNYVDPSLPAGLDQEPDPVARVVYRGSRPYIEINGELHEPTLNITQTGDSYNESAIVRCAKVGFDIVQLNFYMDEFYKGEGNPCNFDKVNRMVRRLLELNPDAKVMMSLRFTMSQWAKDHPDEQVGYGTGAADPTASDEYRQRVVRPSSASDSFRALVRSMINEFGTYVNGMPWRKRLVGLRMSYGVYSEWCCYGFQGFPDTGLRMQEKFRAWELEHRGIANASVPTEAMRRHEYDPSTPKGTNVNKNGDILDPAQDQLVLDYYQFLADNLSDLLLDMAQTARQAFPGRLIGAYYGYIYSEDPPEGANSMLEKVLSSPYIDFLSNPPTYSTDTRRAGGSYGPRSIPSAFRRHGKLSFLEDDSRFHHIRSWLKSDNDGLALCTADAQETEMNMRRNWLNQFFDGDGIQLNDPLTQSGTRPHAFDDPAVFKAITESRAALAAAGEPTDQSGNKMAVIISERERLRRDGGVGSYFSWNIYLTPLPYLYRTGVAFDVLSLEDYLENPRDYKILMFLNAFYLTASERATIIAQTRKPGMSVIWVGPAGGVTETGFSDAAMTELTGIASSGVARRPKVTWSGCNRLLIGNDFYSYVKTNASGTVSILMPEFPNSPAGYRQILQAAGAWFYTDPGSYFRRHGNVFMYHTGTTGAHTIRLPDNVTKVKELFTGAEYTSNVISLQADGPKTWLFKATTLGPWEVGADVTASIDSNGVLSFVGSGAMQDFAAATDVPWDPSMVSGVVVGNGISLGSNALAALSDSTAVTFSGSTVGSLRNGLGQEGGSLPAGMIAVSKTELEAAGAATLDVADGTAILGISVCTNADLTASRSTWKPVSFKKSELDVSADGTKILAPIPANAEKGFMILRSSER